MEIALQKNFFIREKTCHTIKFSKYPKIMIVIYLLVSYKIAHTYYIILLIVHSCYLVLNTFKRCTKNFATLIFSKKNTIR